MNKVNLAEKLSQITGHWKPRILCELNGQELKLVKVRGTFVWHHIFGGGLCSPDRMEFFRSFPMKSHEPG